MFWLLPLHQLNSNSANLNRKGIISCWFLKFYPSPIFLREWVSWQIHVCLKWDITHHMKWQDLTNKVINVNTFHGHQRSKGTEWSTIHLSHRLFCPECRRPYCANTSVQLVNYKSETVQMYVHNFSMYKYTSGQIQIHIATRFIWSHLTLCEGADLFGPITKDSHLCVVSFADCLTCLLQKNYKNYCGVDFKKVSNTHNGCFLPCRSKKLGNMTWPPAIKVLIIKAVQRRTTEEELTPNGRGIDQDIQHHPVAS